MSDAAFATLLVLGVKGYLAAGAVFALGFVTLGVQRLDPAASKSSLGFRVMILPGVAVLWPLLALRLARGRSTPTECNAHRAAAARRAGRASRGGA